MFRFYSMIWMVHGYVAQSDYTKVHLSPENFACSLMDTRRCNFHKASNKKFVARSIP